MNAPAPLINYCLKKELDWLFSLIVKRLAELNLPAVTNNLPNQHHHVALPDLEELANSHYGNALAELATHGEIGMLERLLLVTALAPHEKPDLLDIFGSFDIYAFNNGREMGKRV